MQSLSLSSYFDILPQPALILESVHDTSLNVTSFRVCYVNREFDSIIRPNSLVNRTPGGTEVGNQRNIIGADFNEAILQKMCLYPTPTQFTDWALGILLTPSELHCLKSRFKVPTVNENPPTFDQSESVIDIEWSGLAMKGKYAILTGRKSSPNTPSTSSTSPEPLPGRDVRSADPLEIDDHPSRVSSNPNSPKTPTTQPIRQKVSRSPSKDIKSTSPTASSPVLRPRLTSHNSFPIEDGPTSTWRNNEKVSHQFI